MSDEDLYNTHECQCTDPTHGGKLWLCDTAECKYNKEEEDHPNTCRCEVCRFWS